MVQWLSPELWLCVDSNPARDLLEIRDGENLWQWSPGNKAKRLLSVSNTKNSSLPYRLNPHGNKEKSFYENVLCITVKN